MTYSVHIHFPASGMNHFYRPEIISNSWFQGTQKFRDTEQVYAAKVSVIFSVLIYISGRKIKSTSYYLQKWLLPSHWAPCLSIWKIKIHKTWLDRMFKMEKQLNKFLNGKRQRRLWNKVTNHWIVERIDSSKQLVTLKLTISPYFKNSVCTSS
jgi:hypothetical protein